MVRLVFLRMGCRVGKWILARFRPSLSPQPPPLPILGEEGELRRAAEGARNSENNSNLSSRCLHEGARLPLLSPKLWREKGVGGMSEG
jgi:hypothetical protein